mmetsp:Transcript_81195/g.209010  ORF Transcript_81195/g.209010 Transcript_81195/m.209010 type:complete len:202 (+) Transcript_81195:1808-2413(+)
MPRATCKTAPAGSRAVNLSQSAGMNVHLSFVLSKMPKELRIRRTPTLPRKPHRTGYGSCSAYTDVFVTEMRTSIRPMRMDTSAMVTIAVGTFLLESSTLLTTARTTSAMSSAAGGVGPPIVKGKKPLKVSRPMSTHAENTCCEMPMARAWRSSTCSDWPKMTMAKEPKDIMTMTPCTKPAMSDGVMVSVSFGAGAEPLSAA